MGICGSFTGYPLNYPLSGQRGPNKDFARRRRVYFSYNREGLSLFAMRTEKTAFEFHRLVKHSNGHSPLGQRNDEFSTRAYSNAFCPKVCVSENLVGHDVL